VGIVEAIPRLRLKLSTRAAAARLTAAAAWPWACALTPPWWLPPLLGDPVGAPGWRAGAAIHRLVQGVGLRSIPTWLACRERAVSEPSRMRSSELYFDFPAGRIAARPGRPGPTGCS